MKSVPLTVYPRTAARRAGANRLRREGRAPAIIYGRRAASQTLELRVKQLEDLLQESASENILVQLTVEGDARAQRLALVQEVQHHPLTGRVLHVDFHEVAEDERVTITVPVEATGEAVGVKTGGGVLEHVLFKLKVRALPKDLPETITVDVSHLEIGQAIHIGDIAPPANVEILGDKTISVLAVAAPVSEAQEAAAEAEAAEGAIAEPEVLTEKKEEGAEEGKAPEKGAEKGAAKGAEKGAEKGAKGAEKAGAKAPEKPGAKAAEKPGAKAGEKPAERKK